MCKHSQLTVIRCSCYDFSNVTTYLGRADVRAQLGVGDHKWSDCNRVVSQSPPAGVVGSSYRYRYRLCPTL